MHEYKNKDLETLSQWLNMIFHHKNMIVYYRNVELIIDNNTIEHVTQFKPLGVWLHNSLAFTIHCIKLRSSINIYEY